MSDSAGSNPFAPLPGNRSIPDVQVIPVLHYADVGAAAAWLCRAFGFRERLRIAGHRVQLAVGTGAVVVAEGAEPAASPAHSVMVRVVDVDARWQQALAAGAQGVRPPTDHPYGERQCTVVDPGGHVWTFSQTLADVDPGDWGGVWVDRDPRT